MKTLYFNGNIIPMTGEEDRAEAVLIDGEKIIAVGTLADVEAQCDAETKKVDLEGQTMIPAFYDGHSHYGKACQLSIYENLSCPPVGKIKNIEDMVNALSLVVGDYSKENPLIGIGYDNSSLEDGRHPTKFDLDRISTEVPVYVIHASMHMAVLNSVALEIAGITEETPNPDGGVISRVHGSQEPDGLLQENAFMPVLIAALPKIDDAMITKMITSGELEYASHGVTTAQDGFTTNDDFGFFKRAQELGVGKIDVKAYPPIAGAPSVMTDGTAGMKLGDVMNNFEFSGYKLLLDGSPQGRTAWMLEPYENLSEAEGEGYCGVPIWNDDAPVIEACERALRENAQLLIHTNGDASTEQLIRCLEIAKENTGIDPIDRRFVSIHTQTATPSQIDRLGALGICPSFFTAHIYFWGDAHIENMGLERASYFSNMKRAIDNGMSCTDHDDTPVLPCDPILSIWTACVRETRNGTILGEDLRVKRYDALKSNTVNGAYQYFEEDIRGTIEPGKQSDLVILDKDILSVEDSEIPNVKVMETIKKGQTIYKA